MLHRRCLDAGEANFVVLMLIPHLLLVFSIADLLSVCNKKEMNRRQVVWAEFGRCFANVATRFRVVPHSRRIPAHLLVLFISLPVVLLPNPSEASVEAWVQRYGNLASSVDQGKKVVTESSGVIVAGETDDGISGQDVIVIKYSNEGSPLWTNRYDGPANDRDVVDGLAVDNNGNVFVVGTSTGKGSGSDFLIIKYSSNGAGLWTNRYNGSANNSDIAHAVFVDNAGSVVAAGASVGVGTGDDFVTIKYSNAGVALWTNRYTGPGNDIAYGIAGDSDGNVFVTGSSMGTGSGSDFATVAYSNTGTPLWTNRYNGPGNGSDTANTLAVGSVGNVVVAGTSVGSGTGNDFTAIAYSSAGIPLWTNRYSGPGGGPDTINAMTVDQDGNVFITGSSSGGGNSDFATIGYSASGVPLWTNRYQGGLNSSDIAKSVVVGSNGKVFVTGSSGNGDRFSTIAYSNAGEPLWTNFYGNLPATANIPYGAAIGAGDGVLVTGYSWSGSSFDMVVIAYSNDGVAMWTNLYDGFANGRDIAAALAVDGSGHVYVTGDSASTGSGQDFATIKYSNNGVALWTNRYNGLANGTDVASAVAVDSRGYVFVAGGSTGIGTGFDITTIAYSDMGDPVWTNRYGGPGLDDWFSAMAVDRVGDVIVSGSSSEDDGHYDYVTMKYSSDGVALWTNHYNNSEYSLDYVAALAVDSNCNVFVTGTVNASQSTLGWVTIAYSSDGLPLWTNRYSSGTGAVAAAVVVVGNGNVIVAGYSSSGSGNDDYTTVAYSNTGVPLWTNRYHGNATGRDAAASIAVDANNRIFVTGTSIGIAGKFDIATVAYSSTGSALWTNRYLGPGNSDDFANAIAVDRDGNVLVCGYSSSNSNGYDFVTIKYSNTGMPISTNLYGGSANGDDLPQSAFALAVAPDGDVFVTGASDANYSSGKTFDFVTIKYASVPEPFELSTPARLLDGNFGFNLTAVSRLSYRIDASTDLVSWMSLTNVFYTNGPIQFMDLQATNFPRRFYRALWQP